MEVDRGLRGAEGRGHCPWLGQSCRCGHSWGFTCRPSDSLLTGSKFPVSRPQLLPRLTGMASIVVCVQQVNDFSGGCCDLYSHAMVCCLQAYAASFFLIPLIRWVINQGRNRNIQQRNEARQNIAALLQRPDSRLRAKLQSASEQAQRTVISDKDIVYSSNKDFVEQNLDLDGESFDKKLAELERGSAFNTRVDRGGDASREKKAFEW